MHPLPPGPSRIGPIDFIRFILQSPEPFLHRMAREYGLTFRINARPSAGGPSTITGDPDIIKIIYTTDPDHFEARGVEFTTPIFGHHGVTVTSGAKHKRDRRLLSAPFHAALKTYGDIISEITRETLDRLPKHRPFSLLDTTQSIALDVIIRAVFGVEGAQNVQEVRHAILHLIDSLHPALIFTMALRREFFGFGPWARFCRAKNALDELLRKQIRARRSEQPGSENRRDILSLLVQVQDEDGSMLEEEELLDQLRTVLFAGHETTATAMAWAIRLLDLHKEPMAKFHEELSALGPSPDPNAFSTLPYLEAICQETLRMYPPVVDVGRVLKKSLDLGPYTLPAGEAIVASPILAHNNSALYPEAHAFRPERFLERKFSPFEFIPFGGGARRCLGAAFAMYEMKVVLGTAFSSGGFRSLSSAPVQNIRRGLTMGPKGGIPMTRT